MSIFRDYGQGDAARQYRSLFEFRGNRRAGGGTYSVAIERLVRLLQLTFPDVHPAVKGNIPSSILYSAGFLNAGGKLHSCLCRVGHDWGILARVLCPFVTLHISVYAGFPLGRKTSISINEVAVFSSNPANGRKSLVVWYKYMFLELPFPLSTLPTPPHITASILGTS